MRKNRKNNSRTRGKRICITAFLLAGSLMLGGCGGKKEKAADSELPEIVIGMDYFEPYSYQTSDGEYKGIDVELAQEAFQRLGYQPKFENIVWEDKDELLADRTIDCLWSSYSMNGREDKYQWAGPYLYSRQMVVVRAESEIKKVQDLKGKRVAVQATTKAEDLFLHNIDSDLPQMEQVNCFSTTNELYAALRKNYVDAIAGHEAMLNSLVQDGEGSYRMLEESIYTSKLGIAFKKGTHKELTEELTETLKEMQGEGITEKIVIKYGLDADKILPGGENK
ncbi:transporter substrate-binding domain-containing protein [Blautia glucerasea]|uniref:substrate-binding periplasmic protein n=1 Tax=Blautia glucerasea TaxID=536633 RepID=UPI001D09107C|nr:transporter substrate-binding domain-containing protein [Blautia glucerasea]MCB6370021.1 transporter substrate-binding domain-containing protein [Blautia glucerasea]